MFDTSKDFTVQILSGTEKKAVLRYPTDQEWCDRSRKHKIVRRIIGRGKSQQQAGDLEAVDHDLFLALAKNGAGDTFDKYEAAKAVDRLARAEVIDVERIGNEFRVALKVFGGATVVHVLKIPTQKDVLEYGRASVHVTDMRRAQEIRVALEPSGELWQKLMVSTEGYAERSSVPIVHKDAAVVEILAQVSALEDEPDPED